MQYKNGVMQQKMHLGKDSTKMDGDRGKNSTQEITKFFHKANCTCRRKKGTNI